MNVVTRGIRNAFRNAIRTTSIVIILGLSIGLSLTMLIAHQAVSDKIASVKSSIGNTVSISPAGFRGMEGGGDPLTTDQLKSVAQMTHVTHLDQTVTDRLSTDDNTNLQSAIEAGALGKRFAGSGGERDVVVTPEGAADPAKFTPPIAATGTTNPAKSEGATLKLTSGKQIDGSKDDNVALVGKQVADKNGLKVGSTFTAYDTTITVAGIFDTGTSFANNSVIFSLPTLQRLSSQTNNVTSATVTVDSISNIDSVVSNIKSKLGSSADVTSSKDSAQEAVAPLESIKNVSLFSLIGAVVAGSVIILLTMIMIVRERQREIGVLKAIGGSNARIMFQFMTEALTLTILGAAIGLFIGVIGGNPVTKTLVTNAANSSSTPAGPAALGERPSKQMVQVDGSSSQPRVRGLGGRLNQNSAVRNVRNIQAEIGWSILAYGLGAALLIALLGSAVAAGLIAKVRPAQVMRTE